MYTKFCTHAFEIIQNSLKEKYLSGSSIHEKNKMHLKIKIIIDVKV